jgi:hypothetical protein
MIPVTYAQLFDGKITHLRDALKHDVCLLLRQRRDVPDR